MGKQNFRGNMHARRHLTPLFFFVACSDDDGLGLLLVQREDKLDVVFGEGRAVSEAADAAEEQPRDDLKA